MPEPDFFELPTIDGPCFGRLTGLIYRHTGIRLGANKAYFLTGRLGRLYRSLGCSNWDELADRLESASRDLSQALIQSVVTAETRFFRDDVPFRALAERIAPELVSGRSPPTRLRIWSAGCSTGQEPYSAVMALWNWAERGGLDLDVWATDISAGAVESARRGVYDGFDLSRGLPPGMRSRFFDELGHGAARVREEVRARVRFERLNLFCTDFVRPQFHVVFCRNVSIYFDRPGKERLYSRLSKAVIPGGYLVLGAAETLLPSVRDVETVYFDRYLLFRKSVEVPDEAQKRRRGPTR